MIIGKITKVEASFNDIRITTEYALVQDNNFDYTNDLHIVIYGEPLEGTNLYSVRNILTKDSYKLFFPEYEDNEVYIEDSDLLLPKYINKGSDIYIVKYKLSKDIGELKDILHTVKLKTDGILEIIEKLEEEEKKKSKSIFSFLGFRSFL